MSNDTQPACAEDIELPSEDGDKDTGKEGQGKATNGVGGTAAGQLVGETASLGVPSERREGVLIVVAKVCAKETFVRFTLSFYRWLP